MKCEMITYYFTCTSANVIYCMTCTLCKKLYIGETERRLDDRFRKHLLDVQKLDENASKPVAGTLIALIILSSIWQSGPFLSARKHGKPFHLFFKSALLILTVLTTTFHSTNLFSCFSRYEALTDSVASIPHFAPTKG